MLEYLVILLDETSASFCHYTNPCSKRKSISQDILHKGIRFAMKQNLMIQFVYPDYPLPKEIEKEIETIDNSKIKPASVADEKTSVVIVDNWEFVEVMNLHKSTTLRVLKDDFFFNYLEIVPLLKEVPNLNVVIMDIDRFSEQDFKTYREILLHLSEIIESLYLEGFSPQTNLLTDRMILKKMNNCNAGEKSITLAPNGKFYTCPAFYYDNIDESIGDVESGLNIKNQKLYKIECAPICRRCDAFQCKRCIWLNRTNTFEVNTPSHEQCVVAHLERNASRKLLQNIRKHGIFLPEQEEIKEIDYLDPFEKRELWQ